MATTYNAADGLIRALKILTGGDSILDTVQTDLRQILGTDLAYSWQGSLGMYTVATDAFATTISSNLPKTMLTATGANVLTLTQAVQGIFSDDGSSGYKLSGWTSYATIGTLALTSQAVTLSEITYAAPPTAAARAISGTPPTATGAAATAYTVDVPFFPDGDAKGYSLNYVITPQNTSTWSLFGTRFAWSRT